MKLIITEDKMNKIFTKFMEDFFDLTYRTKDITYRGEDITRYEFLTKNDDTFGVMYENDAFFPSFSQYEKIYDFFGDVDTDKLLLQYLRDKFGDKILFRRIA
jgi:hypothetical protein